MSERVGKILADYQNRPPFIRLLELLTKEFALRLDRIRRPLATFGIVPWEGFNEQRTNLCRGTGKR